MSEILHVGMRNGHNANFIYVYDGANEFEDTAICMVYGIPQYKCVDEVAADAREQAGLANARRLVAAWNACEGIPTEALEKGVVGEMLAVVESILDNDGVDNATLIRKARAVIARAGREEG